MATLPGFSSARIDTGEVRLHVLRAGKGDPLILLHGFPQNHRCWEKVAPVLASRFDVIIPDLRGYGGSDAPPDDAGHTVYSKRRMAGDIVGLMDALGLARAHVLGHDRGARVAYRLALDHPGRLARLGTATALGRTPASPEDVVRRLGAVTAEEVQDLARRFLRLDNSAWAAVGPSADRLRQVIRPYAEVA